MLGILLAESQNGGGRVWIGLGLLVLAGAVAPIHQTVPRVLWMLLGVGCVFGGLHSQRLAETFGHPMLAWLESAQAPQGRLVEVAAEEIRSEVSPTGRVRSLLQVKEVQEKGPGGVSWTPDTDTRFTALLPEGHPPLRSARCRLIGILRPPQRALNSGEFDARSQSLRSGVLGSLTVTQVLELETERWPALRWLREGAAFCRASIQRRLGVGLADQPEELSVIRAMVLGASEDTDPRIEDSFRRSGTLHVFAVSGLHVALISVILQMLLRPFCLRRQHLVWLVVPLVFAYAYITGWRPSAARAALMVTVILSSSLVMRRANLINSLGGAALVLLAWDPHQLFQAGFQLSFGVLLAIALLAGPLNERCKPWTALDPFLPPALASPSQRAGKWLRSNVAALATVSAAAWLGSLPLMWYHFHTVTPAALLANCLLIPLAFLCLGLACSSLVASLLPLMGWVQITLNQICAQTAGLMIHSAALFSQIPGASFNVPPVTQARESSAVELRCFALSYGAEAGLLRVGDRSWMLDCGDENALARVIYPALRQAAVNQLDGVFLSHADAGHIGGLETLASSLRVQTLFHPQHEPWKFDSSASKMRRALEKPPLMASTWPARRSLRPGDVVALGGDLRPSRLTALYPEARDAHGMANDRGLVARLELGGLRVLWMADAGFITETALVDRLEDLRCDVLIRGAHETDVHGTWTFLEAAAPSVILSAGSERAPELKLPAEVKRYADQKGVRLLVLPECGEVTIRLATASADHFTLKTNENAETFRIPLQRPLPAPLR
jgi:ComEC/Rec2-related protein